MSKRHEMMVAEARRVQRETNTRIDAQAVAELRTGMRAAPSNMKVNEHGEFRLGDGYFEVLSKMARISDKGRVAIAPQNAEQVQAFYIAQSRLCDTMATLPLKFYRRRRDGGKTQLITDPRQRIIDDELNRWTTAANWRWSMWWEYGTWGRSVTRLVKNPVLEIPTWGELLSQENGLEVVWTPDGPVYKYTPPGRASPIDYAADEVMDLRMSSKNVLTPMSFVIANQMGMKLSYYLERYGTRYFEEAGAMHGLVRIREQLSDEEADNLYVELTDDMSGSENNHRVGLLQHDAEYLELGKDAEKSQFTQSKAHQGAVLAAAAGVPPHLAGELSRSTYSNIYQQSTEFAIFMVAPRCIALEKTLRMAMLTDIEKASDERYYFKHSLQSLLRGDPEVRFRNYEIATQGARPFMSINDVRELEDMDPVSGGDQIPIEPDDTEVQDQMRQLREQMETGSPLSA